MPKNVVKPHTKIPAGFGRKRRLLDVAIERLQLDPQNPRLPEEIQGSNQPEMLTHLYEHLDLEEIAEPMATHGYFDEEPLVVVPIDLPKNITPEQGKETKGYVEFLDTCNFTVVEGNRRLATALILQDDALRKKLKTRTWPPLNKLVRNDLEILPVIVYPRREEVLPYLGVRNITGTKKWESYPKARYIALMLDQGHSIERIEHEVGDRSQAVVKNAVAFKTLQQARTELDWDIRRAKQDFSYLLLGIGQRSIKLFLGWSKQTGRNGDVKAIPFSEVSLEAPVPTPHLPNLRDLLSWIYGEGTKTLPVIKESRDITNLLTHVIASPTAVEYLRKTRDLEDAYDLSDGEEAMVRKFLAAANTKLQTILGVAHRHKTADVIADAEKCSDTAAQIVKTVKS